MKITATIRVNEHKIQVMIPVTSALRRPFLFTYLFLYKLIHEAVIFSHNTTLHKKTTKLWIEFDVERNGHCLEKLTTNTKDVSHDSPARYPVSGATVDRH